MTFMTHETPPDLAALAKLKSAQERIREQIRTVVIGQEAVVEQLLIAIFAGGHCILEGVPGLAKTLLVQTVARSLSLNFGRIQFTPDLMPADITGTEVLHEDRQSGTREFKFVHGPIFANILLADEINRTPPKTQAALLQGMQERQISAGNHHYQLPSPFFVLATQNPIEQEGTYPLPEAQLDRFLMKVIVGYPTRDEERKIYRAMTGAPPGDPTPVLNGEEVLALQALIRRVPISDLLVDYTMNIVRATRKDDPDTPSLCTQLGVVGCRSAWWPIDDPRCQSSRCPVWSPRGHPGRPAGRSGPRPAASHRIVIQRRGRRANPRYSDPEAGRDDPGSSDRSCKRSTGSTVSQAGFELRRVPFSPAAWL